MKAISNILHVKFNLFERVAGFFFLGAFGLLLASLVSVAIKQGWFDSRVHFFSVFESANGVHAGTAVQVSGLRAGSVDGVDLTKDNRIVVHFYVLSKYRDRIRKNSVTQLLRPFVIGERILDISVGTESMDLIAKDGEIPSVESLDMLSILSGKNLNAYLKSFGGLLDNLKFLVEAFADKNRTEAIIKSFDRIDPLLQNLNMMSIEMVRLSSQMTKGKHLPVLLSQLRRTTTEINQILPHVKRMGPQMTKDVGSLLANMTLLTEQFKSIIPVMAELAPDLPRVSRRAIEALDQSVVLMKALQKSYFIRSHAEDVREEESLAHQKPIPSPSSSPDREPAGKKH